MPIRECRHCGETTEEYMGFCAACDLVLFRLLDIDRDGVMLSLHRQVSPLVRRSGARELMDDLCFWDGKET